MGNCEASPCAIKVEKDEDYYWCRCAKTANEPLCDGSHKGTDITPMSFSAKETGTVYLCGCKKTNNPPYCDGMHKPR